MLVAVATCREAAAVLAGLGAACSAPNEWNSVSLGAYEVLVTGVGKINAAGSIVRQFKPDQHGAVIVAGIAGVLPGAPGHVGIGSVIAASASILADEGARTPLGFKDCATLGFRPSRRAGPIENVRGFAGSSWAADPGLIKIVGPLTHASGPIATVSTCSATNELAVRTSAETGAIAEAMEGAAVAQVLDRLVATGPGTPFVEIRSISNTTGDRHEQMWNLEKGFSALQKFFGRLRSISLSSQTQ